MNVASILGVKGRDVVSVSQDTTLQDVTRTLAQHKIGAVIVTDSGAQDGRLVGIISERDIIKAIAAHGPESLSRSAASTMTDKVVTCSPADTVDRVMELMTAGRFRHVPVIDDSDRLTGLISIGDVVKNHIAEVEMEASALKSYLASG